MKTAYGWRKDEYTTIRGRYIRLRCRLQTTINTNLLARKDAANKHTIALYLPQYDRANIYFRFTESYAFFNSGTLKRKVKQREN